MQRYSFPTTLIVFTLLVVPLLSYFLSLSLSSLLYDPEPPSQSNKDIDDHDHSHDAQHPSSSLLGNGAMFDALAHRYDWVNSIMAMGMDSTWRFQLIQQLKQQLDANYNNQNNHGDDANYIYSLLDMATGTGEVAMQLARTFPQSPITAVDPSSGMLQQAQQKVATRLPNTLVSHIRWVQGDAQDLDLQPHTSMTTTTTTTTTTSMLSEKDDGWGGQQQQQQHPARFFDGATMAFGIRNIPQRSQALCEIHSFLQPNQGVLAIMEFSEPDPQQFGVLGWLARWFIRYVIPVVGGVMSLGHLEEYMYLQRSIQDFPSPPEFVSLLESLECNTSSRIRDENEETSHHHSVVGTSTGPNRGYYQVHATRHLNFGSVQIYTMTARTEQPVAVVVENPQETS